MACRQHDDRGHRSERLVVRRAFSLGDTHDAAKLVTPPSRCRPTNEPLADTKEHWPGFVCEELAISGRMRMQREGERNIEGDMLFVPRCLARPGCRFFAS